MLFVFFTMPYGSQMQNGFCTHCAPRGVAYDCKPTNHRLENDWKAFSFAVPFVLRSLIFFKEGDIQNLY